MNTNHNQHELNIPVPLGGTGSGQMTVHDPYSNNIISESELTIQDIWRAITKHKGIIFAICFLAVITTTIATLLMRPVYRASSLIEISPKAVARLKTNTIDSPSIWSKSQYQATQRGILLSRSLAKVVVDKLNLQNVPEINNDLRQRGFVAGVKDIIKSIVPKDDSDKSLEIPADKSVFLVGNFRSRFAINTVRRSNLLKVSFESFDPKLSADVVNTAVSEYMRLDRQRRLDSTSDTKIFLKSEIASIQAKLESSERDLTDFARKHNITDLEEGGNIVTQRLSQLNHELTLITSARVAAEVSWNQASLGRDLNALPAVLTNSLVKSLKITQTRLQGEYLKLSKIYKSEYPVLKQLKAQLDQTNERLDREITWIVGGLKSTYEQLLNRELSITEKIDEQKNAQLVIKDKSVSYNILKREWESNKELYKALLDALQEVGVAMGMEPNNISVIDAAKIPKHPYKPNLQFNVALAGILGLIGGLAVAGVLLILDNTVRTPDDLEKVVGLASLGMVPIEKKKQKRKTQKNLSDNQLSDNQLSDNQLSDNQLSDNQLSDNQIDVTAGYESLLEFRSYVDRKNHLSEAFRSIRTSLMFSSSVGLPKTIQITSTIPGEGKTTIACNLALVLADNDTHTKVLLIDGDLRRHKLHKVFGMPLSPGLSEAIVSKEHKDFVRNTPIENLYVLPAGTTPPNPAELIGSTKMSDFMQRIAEDYDYVVIDSAPVLGLADAVVLSTKMDGIVYIVNSGLVTKDNLFAGVKRLRSVHAPLLGAILNNVDLSREDYIFYGGYYYAYSNDEFS